MHVACGIAMITSAALRQSEIFMTEAEGEVVVSLLGKSVYKSLNLIAKLFITASFGMVCYVPSELYPTNYR